MIEDAERHADVLDQATQAEDDHKASHIEKLRILAAPEQDGSITECACGNDLGDRGSKLFKIRCIACQEAFEKRQGVYAP